MKTSNKIILGIFVAPLLLLTSVQVALYAKYKSGHYTAMVTVQEDRFNRYALKSVNKVFVQGLNNFTIVPSDSLKLEIEKADNGHVRYLLSGDSLIIRDSAVTRENTNGRPEDARSNQMVTLYLPANLTYIRASNTEVNLQGSKDSMQAKSYQFMLEWDAALKLRELGPGESISGYIKNLKITAAHCRGIELAEHTRVAELQLSVSGCDFTDNNAIIDTLTVFADKASSLTLTGDNLKKAITVH